MRLVVVLSLVIALSIQPAQWVLPADRRMLSVQSSSVQR